MNPYWQDRSIFVTGATGFVGHRLFRALVDSGAKVLALTHHRTPFGGTGRNEAGVDPSGQVHWLEGSLEDRELIERAISVHSVATVFHLAAQPVVELAMADPVTTLETNVRGTWILLEACRRAGVREVLVASSAKAYGEAGESAFTEDNPLRGQFPYDVSKSCADLITTMYARSFGLPTLILRFANLFGGGDLNFSRLIPGVIRSAIMGEPCVIRGNGRAVRDFLYVDDAVDAFLLAAQSLGCDRALAGESFNFGQELRWTVLELAQTILSLIGRADLRPVIQNVGMKDAPNHLLDVSKARNRLNWSPHYTMETGLGLTIDWYRAHLCARQATENPLDSLAPGLEAGMSARASA